MKRIHFALLAAVLALGFAGYRLAYGGPRLSDEERIHQAIEAARVGVVSREVGEIMAHVSRSYDDGNYTFETLRGLIAFGLRQYSHVQVAVYLREVHVQGSKAVASLDVDAVGLHAGGEQSRYRGALEVHFVREPARRHLIFPDHRWRAVRMDHFLDIQDAFER
ncbi:MAG: hypothetical protein GX774_12520 [Armatimonadetes bacterium]|nr:hypothetical protein [Armatimonadota bacterium]